MIIIQPVEFPNLGYPLSYATSTVEVKVSKVDDLQTESSSQQALPLARPDIVRDIILANNQINSSSNDNSARNLLANAAYRQSSSLENNDNFAVVDSIIK